MAAPRTSPKTADATAAVPCQSRSDPAQLDTERTPSGETPDASGMLAAELAAEGVK